MAAVSEDQPAATCSQARSNTVSFIQRWNPGLSIYCLNSSVSSFMREVITRGSALSCSIRVFSRSEFRQALLKAVSAATRAGMVSVISCPTRSASCQAVSPKWSLKVLRMLDSRSSSGSGRCPPPAVGTGSISASESASRICPICFFSTR